VNLYLHGFQDPKIFEYDTLTSEERWDDTVDVILANPPFMTPKGGIKPHKRFSVQANRSEVLFVDYIAEHLNPGGRAGIIVPEGIIFQSSNAYKNLRKMLIDDYLWAVVSLPAGVFQPYSGVKTSILLLDKRKSKESDSILFVKIENDGFGLGAQRRAIDSNDLPEALKILKSGNADNTEIAHWVEKSKIKESGDWNLSGERYKESLNINTKYELVNLGDISQKITKGTTPTSIGFKFETQGINFIKIESISVNGAFKENKFSFISGACNDALKRSQLIEGDILFSIAGALGRVGLVNKNVLPANTNQALSIIRLNEDINRNYIFWSLKSKIILEKIAKLKVGVAQYNLSLKQISELQIPLPPLSVQEEIVSEIEDYQKIIDGARQVVENYKPNIKIDPDWEMVMLGEVCTLIGGGTPSRSNLSFWENGTIKWLSAKYIDSEGKIPSYELITKDALKGSSSKIAPKNSTIAVSRVSVGKVAFADDDYALNQDLTAFVIQDENRVDNKFLFYVIKQNAKHIEKNAQGLGVRGVTRDFLKKMQIPLPPLSTQKEIVAQIEAEQKMVNVNKKLIEIYEQKVKDKIGEVWGEE